MKKKRILVGERLNEVAWLLRCPICKEPCTVDEGTIYCIHQHSFDIAKQGHIHVATKSMDSLYTKDLFEARRQLLVHYGLFTPFLKKVAEIINNLALDKEWTIADMGSGEGSPLIIMQEYLGTRPRASFGFDLAKAGIVEAAKAYEEAFWFVSDLAQTPLSDHSISIVLNILSPSNYEEFGRVLSDRGYIIKVVPRTNYLKEIREAVNKPAYSNEDTVARFNDRFHLLQTEHMTYTVDLPVEASQLLIAMTPLAEHATQEQKSRIGHTFTVDVDILLGQKK
ncbi:SAM-dependent methyltransferase [Paenalkalicoccus suaedae]|uniref:SAM-dependent methyltransferase n=1 Tax=Paenalkalicoccus suaedae TaxID=2592382 RepID=A0A859FDS0_9BACI|nr:SAM-dependent methyltransferase [Paenalkalicoccus suaedae]QKS70376.1 SAM-dependent methyltransferase [Paenalkalicoccus suaedae]